MDLRSGKNTGNPTTTQSQATGLTQAFRYVDLMNFNDLDLPLSLDQAPAGHLEVLSAPLTPSVIDVPARNDDVDRPTSLPHSSLYRYSPDHRLFSYGSDRSPDREAFDNGARDSSPSSPSDDDWFAASAAGGRFKAGQPQTDPPPQNPNTILK